MFAGVLLFSGFYVFVEEAGTLSQEKKYHMYFLFHIPLPPSSLDAQMADGEPSAVDGQCAKPFQ